MKPQHVNPDNLLFNSLQAHRDGCMCIICKQARRVGKTWGGMSGIEGGPKWQAPMLTAGRRGQPVPRFGKRAFLHALPHLVCGPMQHKVGFCCCCVSVRWFCNVLGEQRNVHSFAQQTMTDCSCSRLCFCDLDCKRVFKQILFALCKFDLIHCIGQT